MFDMDANPAGDRVTFLDAAGIAGLGDEQFLTPGRRRDTLRALCQRYSDVEDELESEALAALKGIGPWTVANLLWRSLSL
jgi:AraC family transcriptional regulator of adaptative response / DNA-3-methyladenine glycosylase II